MGSVRYGTHVRGPYDARVGATGIVWAPHGAPVKFCGLFDKNINVQPWQVVRSPPDVTTRTAPP